MRAALILLVLLSACIEPTYDSGPIPAPEAGPGACEPPDTKEIKRTPGTVQSASTQPYGSNGDGDPRDELWLTITLYDGDPWASDVKGIRASANVSGLIWEAEGDYIETKTPQWSVWHSLEFTVQENSSRWKEEATDYWRWATRVDDRDIVDFNSYCADVYYQLPDGRVIKDFGGIWNV